MTVNLDMPTLNSTSYLSNKYDGLGGEMFAHAMGKSLAAKRYGGDDGAWDKLLEAQAGHQLVPGRLPNVFVQTQQEDVMANKDTLRYVQVFIADVDENVPLDKRLLYKGDQKLTDLTDQELFFEIDLKDILSAHNAFRTTLHDKSVKERTEKLEPVRIRDLKMTVVTIADF